MATVNPNLPETGGDDAGEESLRDTIGRAFDEAEAPEPPAAPAAPAAATPPAEPGAPAAPAEPGAPAAPGARDALGRFIGKTPPDAPAGAQEPPKSIGAPVPPAPPAGDPKAPASWKPEVREKWAGIDPDVKAEVQRREFEHQQVLQRSAQHRQFVDAFEQVVRPYEMFIRAENSNPLQAVQNLMQTAAELRVGTPQSKAQLVAGMVANFGVDVQLLDSLLARQLGVGQDGAPAAQPQQFRDPRLDQFLAQQQHMIDQQRRGELTAFEQQLATFAQSHEFYSDVGGLMADLMEVDARQGKTTNDLEKLYERACKMHEGVSNILTQRTAAAKAGTQSAAVLRAKRAAQSVKGEATPQGATVPKDDSVRAAIEAAIDTLGSA